MRPEWIDDATVMESFDSLMLNQMPDLDSFLGSIMEYSDQVPLDALLVLYGKFVKSYNEFRQTQTEIDSFHEAVTKLAEDPLVSQLVATMMGTQLDRRLGVE